MARNKRLWLWILPVILIIFLVWYFAVRTSHGPAEQAALPADTGEPGTATNAPPPTYQPISESSLGGFSTGAEYVATGKVATELLEPLSGAMVFVYGTAPLWSPPTFEQPAPLDTQTCDDTGHYEIRLNTPKNLWMRVRKDGYTQIDAFVPVRDPKTAVRDYQLRPAQSTVMGLVVDKKDVPIAGAVVIANIPPFALLGDSPVLSPVGALTDASGKYTLEGLPEGDVDIVAFARGYVLGENQSPLKAGQASVVNFNLSPGSPISFAVKNGRGEVLPYATATAPGYAKIAGGDRGGVVEFSVPAGTNPFECTVIADGYQANTIQVDPNAPPSVVVLEHKPELKGRIAAESGAAIADALVSVFGAGGAQGKFDGSAQTDKAGRFSLSLSYPPVREIRVSRPGYFDQRLAFDSARPAASEVNILLKRVEAGIYGRVIDYKGIPVKRFVVHVRSASGATAGQDYQRSFVSDRGAFMITDVAPGTYTLVIQSVPSATTDNVDLFSMEGVEIRKAFLFGEILAQFPKPKYKT
jgi:hypothetical protein